MAQEEQLKIQAKAYTELINRLENVKDAIKKQNYGIAMDALCKPYPEFQVTTHSELKDEDERIRKTLVEFFVDWSKSRSHFWSISIQKILSWLEKQGNLMKALQISNSRIGELIEKNYYLKEQLEKQSKNNIGISEATKQKLEDNLNKALEKETPESFNKFLDEQKPVDKVEPKFKVGDTMRTLLEAANGVTNGMPVVVSIDEEYYHCNNELIAIKDQDSYEYPPMNRMQKSAWSEEDEVCLGDAMWAIEQARTIAKNENDMGNLWYAENWLKSLKERYTWKPSDEQMQALSNAGNSFRPFEEGHKVLWSLYNDLKRLREE